MDSNCCALLTHPVQQSRQLADYLADHERFVVSLANFSRNAVNEKCSIAQKKWKGRDFVFHDPAAEWTVSIGGVFASHFRWCRRSEGIVSFQWRSKSRSRHPQMPGLARREGSHLRMRTPRLARTPHLGNAASKDVCSSSYSSASEYEEEYEYEEEEGEMEDQ